MDMSLFTRLPRARLIAAVLALAVAMMACGGGGTSTALVPTATATAVPFTLEIETAPEGAHVDINPEWNGRHFVSGTGRDLGITPVQTILLPSDQNVGGGCGHFILFVWGLSGYEAESDTVVTNCVLSNGSGAPGGPDSFMWTPTLQPCSDWIGPDCGTTSP